MKYFVAVSIFCFVFYLSSREIDVNQKKWRCAKSVCEIEFYVVNLTNKTQNIMYRIKAYDIKTGSQHYSGSAKTLYDRKEKISLKANDSAKVVRTFKPSYSPRSVNVTTWIIDEKAMVSELSD